eukprot:8436800-Lingulodinium_polyedra.AAC.1
MTPFNAAWLSMNDTTRPPRNSSPPVENKRPTLDARLPPPEALPRPLWHAPRCELCSAALSIGHH